MDSDDEDRKFPALRITEEKMTDQEIIASFKSAFGHDFIKNVTNSKGARIIHFDLEGLNELDYDDMVLEEFYKFYKDLDQHGAVWIESNPQDPDNQEILYLTHAEEGFWEVHYAQEEPKAVKSKAVKEPKPVKPKAVKEPKVVKPKAVKEPKVVKPKAVKEPKPVKEPKAVKPKAKPRSKTCTCPCNCGERLGTAI
jgi:hypothetical protein